MKYEIPAMLKSGGGSIVNNSSIYGLAGSLTGLSPYVAAKHGVTGLTRTVAIEYGRQNIRVNAVCPGYILTPMQEAEYTLEMLHACASKIPLERLGSPEDVAALFAFLASDEAGFITGETIVIDGGEIAGGLASQP